MQKFKVVMMVLALTLAIVGNAFAQEGGGGGFTELDFDVITDTGIRSEPYDGESASYMASEAADGATEGKAVFQRVKPEGYLGSYD